MFDLDAYLEGIERLVRSRRDQQFDVLAGGHLAPWQATGVAEGHWRDIITNADGSVRAVTPWNHNLVVNAFANLVAALCLGNGAGTGPNATYIGIQYMAVGTGLASWDTGGTPAPALTDTTLVTELVRKIVQAQFVDGSGNVVAGPTANVLVTCTFNVGEANGALREWGLFGGNATASLGSGIMVDHVTTAALNKPTGVSDFGLTRLVTLIF